jgi:perosamine synthetase
MRYGVAVSNGTAALQLAVGCLNLEPGDEVIMPTFAIISCALAVIYNGGVPVLIDCDPHTWCMDVSQVEAKVTPRTRAIMPVHIYGHPVDMEPLWVLAEKCGLAIVEDAAVWGTSVVSVSTPTRSLLPAREEWSSLTGKTMPR